MEIESQINIRATIEAVWAATTDVEKWPCWTPTVESIVKKSGRPIEFGSEVLIKQPRLPETTWKIIALQEPRLFSWAVRVYGMNMIATHEIVPGESFVTNALVLEVSGFSSVLLYPLIKNKLKKALELENIGLKAYCESSASLIK